MTKLINYILTLTMCLNMMYSGRELEIEPTAMDYLALVDPDLFPELTGNTSGMQTALRRWREDMPARWAGRMPITPYYPEPPRHNTDYPEPPRHDTSLRCAMISLIGIAAVSCVVYKLLRANEQVGSTADNANPIHLWSYFLSSAEN